MVKWGGWRSVTQSGTIQQVSFLLICVYIGGKVHSQNEQTDSNNSRESYTIEGLGIVYRS